MQLTRDHYASVRQSCEHYSGSSECNASPPACIRIAVCDDKSEDSEQLAALLSQLTMHQCVHIDQFASGDALLQAEDSYHIIFLDILMDGTNGMDTARALRQRRDNAVLIFVTCTPAFSLEGYEVEAFRYILKPYDESAVRDVISSAMNRVAVHTLNFQSGGTMYRIPYVDILYIEAQNKRCMLHMANGRETIIHESLSDLSKRVNPEYMMRCQRSFIVNLGKIQSVKRYETELSNGTILPVGRKCWRELQQRLIHYFSLG